MNVDDKRNTKGKVLYAKDVPQGRIFEFISRPFGLRLRLPDDMYVVLSEDTPGDIRSVNTCSSRSVSIIPEDKIRIVIDA